MRHLMVIALTIPYLSPIFRWQDPWFQRLQNSLWYWSPEKATESSKKFLPIETNNLSKHCKSKISQRNIFIHHSLFLQVCWPGIDNNLTRTITNSLEVARQVILIGWEMESKVTWLYFDMDKHYEHVLGSIKHEFTNWRQYYYNITRDDKSVGTLEEIVVVYHVLLLQEKNT